MCGDNAHIPRLNFHQLDLTRCSAWEGHDFGTKTTETGGIIGGFEARDFRGRRGEGVGVETVLERDDDVGAGETDLVDQRAEIKGYEGTLFGIVPNDNLAEREVRRGFFSKKSPSNRPCSGEIWAVCRRQQVRCSWLDQAFLPCQCQH